MLYLTLSVNEEKYAIAANHVVEVLPMLKLFHVPLVEQYIAGIFDYRGERVPVIDLSKLLLHSPCSESLSSRIILIRYAVEQTKSMIVGILAENVTESIQLDAASFISTGLKTSHGDFLKGVSSSKYGLIQLIDPNELLTITAATALAITD